jgi:AcrR family transcriptional regulator
MPSDARYERSKAAVFEAVCSVLVADGVAGLTADRLAEESGVSRSTIYRNWPDLAALTCEVFDELMHRDSAEFASDPVAALRDYLADYARRLNDPTYCAVLIALIEGSMRDDAFADVHSRSFSQTRSRAAEIIRRGQEAGEFRDDLDIKQGVEEIVAPFLYRRLVTQAQISSRQVDHLHQRLIGAWRPPS